MRFLSLIGKQVHGWTLALAALAATGLVGDAANAVAQSAAWSIEGGAAPFAGYGDTGLALAQGDLRTVRIVRTTWEEPLAMSVRAAAWTPESQAAAAWTPTDWAPAAWAQSEPVATVALAPQAPVAAMAWTPNEPAPPVAVAQQAATMAWAPSEWVQNEPVATVALAPLATVASMASAPESAAVGDMLPPPPATPGSGASSATTGAAGEEKPLGPAPQDNRLAFLREVTVLLSPGQWQVDYGINYTMQEYFRPIVLPSLDLGQDRFRQRSVTIPFAARYGVSKRVQAFCNAPLGVGMMDYTNGVFSTTDNVFGLTDVVAGINYLLCKGGDGCPDITMTFDTSAPVGPLPFRDDITLGYLSDGFWSTGVSVLAIHTYDPVVVYYGLGYRHRFERDYLGGVVTPGEEVSYNFGMGFAINDRITLSSTLLGAYQTEYLFNNRTIAGSAREPISIRMALTAYTGKCHIIEPFVFFGLTSDAPNARFGVNVTRTF